MQHEIFDSKKTKVSFCIYLVIQFFRKHKKMSHVFSKTYSCHFCEELFVSEVSVVTHERIHTGIIKFECKICDFKANRYVEMEEHKKVVLSYYSISIS